MDGKGAQIGDFLFAEHGFAMAIVEIKKPASLLLRAKPYRNTEVFAPSADLAGAVTQVLYQKITFISTGSIIRRVQNSRILGQMP